MPGISLEIEDGEFMVLVGPSGCGKSTTLRMLAGLEEVNSGDIYIGDREVTKLPPKDRDIAMVFQNYALYPHMTVEDNMAFALRMAKENWRIVTADEGGLPVHVTVIEELGADSFVYGTCDVEGVPSNIIVRISGRQHPHKGETLHVTTDPHHVHVFDTDTGVRLSD